MARGEIEKEYAHLGRGLRELRVEKGLSQKALAEELGVSFQQIQKYEKGENRIPVIQLALACYALGYPIERLVYEAMEHHPVTRRAPGRRSQRSESAQC